MKRPTHLRPLRHWLSLLSLLVLLGAHGALAAEPATPVLADDPACVGKFRGEICSISDGTGGFCVASRCGKNDRPCLRCLPATPESPGLETLWIPMLSFGMVVAIIGGIFWFRLKRNWNKGEEENRRDS